MEIRWRKLANASRSVVVRSWSVSTSAIADRTWVGTKRVAIGLLYAKRRYNLFAENNPPVEPATLRTRVERTMSSRDGNSEYQCAGADDLERRNPREGTDQPRTAKASVDLRPPETITFASVQERVGEDGRDWPKRRIQGSLFEEFAGLKSCPSHSLRSSGTVDQQIQ